MQNFLNTYLNNSYPDVKQKEKKPLEVTTNIQLLNLSHSLYLNNDKKINKALAGVLATDLTKNESTLRFIDLLFGSSVVFRKSILQQSRDYQARRAKQSTRTIDRNRVRLKQLGMLEIDNQLEKTEDGYRNKISKLNIVPLKEKLSFIKRWNRKKYAFLITALLALGLINIMGGEDINTKLIKNENISLVKYIRSKEITIFGKSGYEISKNYKENRILPTITVPVDFKSLVFNNHPGNILEEENWYTSKNIQDIRKLRINSLKRKGLDIRRCTELDYMRLSYEDKQIASHYFTGRRRYGSVEKYEKRLKELGLCHKIWKPD